MTQVSINLRANRRYILKYRTLVQHVEFIEVSFGNGEGHPIIFSFRDVDSGKFFELTSVDLKRLTRMDYVWKGKG